MLKEKVRLFCNRVLTKWKDASRTETYFKSKYAAWLRTEILFETPSEEPNPSHKASGSGRPSLSYEQKSLRSRRREASQFSKENEDCNVAVMIDAASMAARKQKQTDLASVLKEVNRSPTRPTKIRKMITSPTTTPTPYTPEEALEFILDNNLSKQQYQNIRNGAKIRKCNIYPTYETVLKVKKQCRVPNVTVSDTVAQLQEGDKSKLKENKELLQRRFWEEMALHVDKPKTSGSGNTNDGNTARRAFAHAEQFAKITNIDINLIKSFKNILIALSCQQALNVERFENFCFKTAQLFMELYPWFPMPATVHKVLIHSRQILQHTVLPVGYFGEEASEARNKLYKRDRLFHARKTSRAHNLEDVFNRAIDTSDPVISSINLRQRTRHRHKQQLPMEVIALLEPPEIEVSVIQRDLLAPLDTTDTDSDPEYSDEELAIPESEFFVLDTLRLESE